MYTEDQLGLSEDQSGPVRTACLVATGLDWSLSATGLLRTGPNQSSPGPTLLWVGLGPVLVLVLA